MTDETDPPWRVPPEPEPPRSAEEPAAATVEEPPPKPKRKRKRRKPKPVELTPELRLRWGGAVASEIERGRSEEEMRERLARNGLNESQIDDVVEEAHEIIDRSMNLPDPQQASNSSDIFAGLLWAGFGLMLTVLTFGSSHGVVFYGAIIYGGFRLLRGLSRNR